MTKRTVHRHHRELIELAALFGAASLTDVFADVLGRRIDGPMVLFALAAVLAVAAFAHHLRHRHTAPHPAALGPASAAAQDRTAPGLAAAAGGAGAPAPGLWRVRTVVQDTPGRLSVIAGALAGVGANIVAMQAHPADGAAVDEFLVQTPAGVDSRRLVDALTAAGGGRPHAVPADLHTLVDEPVHALDLARRLADEPHALPRLLADLLGADRVEAVPGGPHRPGIDGGRMLLPGQGTEMLLVRRPGFAFTPTEFARAQAMARLAAALREKVGGAR